MEERFERLAKRLLEKNSNLSPQLALSWVEALWEDYDATHAKAGRTYRGQSATEQYVQQLIQNYGDKLHLFASKNEKFKHLSEFHNNFNRAK